MFELEKEHTMFLLFHSIFEILNIFKEYLKLLNRLYDITWFGSVYEDTMHLLTLTQQKNIKPLHLSTMAMLST
jgi:hypothetical protein